MEKETYYESWGGFKDWAWQTLYYFKLAMGGIVALGCIAYIVMAVTSGAVALQGAL